MNTNRCKRARCVSERFLAGADGPDIEREPDLATAALRPSHHLTGKTACRRDQRRRARFARVQPVRFDRPSGGTAEFLGRDTPVSQPPGRKARRPDPPYVFGAASPAATAINEPRGVSAAKSLRDSLNAFATAQESKRKAGPIRVRPL